MEIPARLFRVMWLVRQVITTVGVLHGDGPEALEPVGTQVQLRTRGEEDIFVFQDAAEGNVAGIGKRRLSRPGLAVILGEENFILAEAEGLVPSLRINVRARRRQAVMKVERLALGSGV